MVVVVVAYVVDVEGLADADGDEGLGAEALQGEGHAARGDVPDRAERLEDPHTSPGRGGRRGLLWSGGDEWVRRRRGF